MVLRFRAIGKFFWLLQCLRSPNLFDFYVAIDNPESACLAQQLGALQISRYSWRWSLSALKKWDHVVYGLLVLQVAKLCKLNIFLISSMYPIYVSGKQSSSWNSENYTKKILAFNEKSFPMLIFALQSRVGNFIRFLNHYSMKFTWKLFIENSDLPGANQLTEFDIMLDDELALSRAHGIIRHHNEPSFNVYNQWCDRKI